MPRAKIRPACEVCANCKHFTTELQATLPRFFEAQTDKRQNNTGWCRARKLHFMVMAADYCINFEGKEQ